MKCVIIEKNKYVVVILSEESAYFSYYQQWIQH